MKLFIKANLNQNQLKYNDEEDPITNPKDWDLPNPPLKKLFKPKEKIKVDIDPW